MYSLTCCYVLQTLFEIESNLMCMPQSISVPIWPLPNINQYYCTHHQPPSPNSKMVGSQRKYGQMDPLQNMNCHINDKNPCLFLQYLLLLHTYFKVERRLFRPLRELPTIIIRHVRKLVQIWRQWTIRQNLMCFRSLDDEFLGKRQRH